MVPPGDLDRYQVADRLHSAAIHLLRYARNQDLFSRQAPARLSALSVLVFGGSRTLGQLAEAEQVKAPTMTRIVAGLKRSGLARIKKDSNDARRVLVSVTPKGERLFEQARQRRIQIVAETLGPLGEEELATLDKAAALIEQQVHPPVSG
jgi:DNA-binding MarR family transcriptional regulator